MATKDNRTAGRASTSMRIKLKYPDLDTFIQKYAVNISRGGIFISTKTPKAVGTQIRFEFLLADPAGTSIIRGEGQVQWTREYDPETPSKAHGMGLKFTRLEGDSQSVIDRALAFRAEHPGGRREAERPSPPASSSPPPPESQPPAESDPLMAQPTEPNQLLGDGDTNTIPIPVGVLPPEAPLGSSPVELSGRAAGEHTVPLPVGMTPVGAHDALMGALVTGRAPDRQTLPITTSAPGTTGADSGPISADDSVRIALDRHRQHRSGRSHGEELDALAAEWGVTRERMNRVLKKPRPRMSEATAELEHLLLRSRAPAVSKAEALAKIDDVLQRGPKPGGSR